MQKSTEPEASTKETMQSKRALLESELNAIESWDEDYRLKEAPDAVEEFAFKVRQERREEILRTMQNILTQQSRAAPETQKAV